MRSIMIALVLAAGFGLAGTSSTLSAPLSGKVLGDIAKSEVADPGRALPPPLPPLPSFGPPLLAHLQALVVTPGIAW